MLRCHACIDLVGFYQKGYFLNKMEYRVLHLIRNVIIDFSQLLYVGVWKYGYTQNFIGIYDWSEIHGYDEHPRPPNARRNVSFGFKCTFLPIKQLG